MVEKREEVGYLKIVTVMLRRLVEILVIEKVAEGQIQTIREYIDELERIEKRLYKICKGVLNIKRWEVTYLEKPFMLYGNTVEEVIRKYSSTIDEGSNIVPIPYPQELFDVLTQLPVIGIDNKGREYRQVNLGYGYCTYRISKDKTDGNYYDLVQYRISGNRLVEPCLWSACTAQDFVNWYLKPVPDKRCGWSLSLKEVKKLCGKVQFKVGKVNVWKDSDDYYYIGWQLDWSKYQKEEYKIMSEHRETAVRVCFTEGICGGYKHKWFISEDM